MKKQSKTAPWWKLHSGLVIVVAVAVIMLAILSIFRFPAAGQATGLVRVCDDITDENNALDLDTNARLQLDVSQVESCLLLFTSSEEGANPEYFVLIVTSNRDGTLQYVLKRQDGTEVLALGLLGPQLSDTRGILVNTEDIVSDVEFHYANGLFEVVNLRSVPSAAPVGIPSGTIKLFKTGAEDERDALQKLLMPLVGVEGKYSLKISPTTATSGNVVSYSARVDNQDIRLAPGVRALAAGVQPSSEVKVDFNWTPTATRAYNLTLFATLQVIGANNVNAVNKTIQESYILAGDGIIYQLSNDAQYSQVTLKLKNEQTREAQVTYIFQNNTDKQPFSVPCSGATQLESLQLYPAPTYGSTPPTTSTNAGSLLEVFGYNAQQQRTQGWRADAPSEFAQLVPYRGYTLKLKDLSTPWMFTLTCTLPEQPELPSLVRGWNLVSITGYTPVAVAEIAVKKAPPGTSIIHAKELQKNDAVSSTDVTSLVPGKAYWLLVQ